MDPGLNHRRPTRQYRQAVSTFCISAIWKGFFWLNCLQGIEALYPAMGIVL